MISFGIAFIVGLLTIGILIAIREEGEVGREVIFESLMSPMREFSRPMSSVPGFTLLSNFPFGFVKRVPVPGLDVAMGVTAYQIGEMARTATLAAVSGKRLTTRLVRALDEGMASIWKDREEVKTHGVEIARQAARGAVHAATDTPLAVENLVVPVATGVAKVATKAGADPLNGIKGASQGIIQGAIETGADLVLVTEQMIAAARKAAAQLGLSEEAAVTQATEGVLEAAEASGADVLARVKEALPSDTPGEDAK